MPKSAVLLTWSGDSYTPDRVAEGLRRRGIRPIRVDTDLFPTSIQLRWSLGGSGTQLSASDPLDLDGEEVVGIWWRRFWAPQLPEDLETEHQAACIRESHAALLGYFLGFPHAKHTNHPHAERAAENKLLQLSLARQSGLRCPESLVTNDPQAVRNLYARLQGRMVTKMLSPYSRSMEGNTAFVYTSRITPEDLEALDGLSLCPMVFQEEIQAVREHRMIWVGGRILGGYLSREGIDEVDWRRQRGLHWKRSEVPETVARGMNSLMAQLSLNYGAFDLMETPEGEWYFLEVNPGGEWGMLERDLDLPIGDAIASTLLGESL